MSDPWLGAGTQRLLVWGGPASFGVSSRVRLGVCVRRSTPPLQPVHRRCLPVPLVVERIRIRRTARPFRPAWRSREAHLSAQEATTCPEARLPSPHVGPRRSGDRQGSAPQGPSSPVGLRVEPASAGPCQRTRGVPAVSLGGDPLARRSGHPRPTPAVRGSSWRCVRCVEEGRERSRPEPVAEATPNGVQGVGVRTGPRGGRLPGHPRSERSGREHDHSARLDR